MTTRIDYLVIGHVAQDVRGSGFTLGGSAIYAAIMAAKLGRRAAVVTACQPGIDLHGTLGDAPVCFAPSASSTTFANAYRDGRREQYLRSRAADLAAEHVPRLWRTCRIVHIAPIAQELTPEIVDAFPGSFVGVTLQGWLRGWDSRGRVFFQPRADIMPGQRREPGLAAPDGSSNRLGGSVERRINAVVLSEEDAEFREDVIDTLAALAPVVAVTLGKSGAKVHWAGRWQHFPAFPAHEVDPTGAGDVFAAAFFCRMEQTRDPLDATVFANCAASFAVEAVGTAGLPTLDMVEKRLRGAE